MGVTIESATTVELDARRPEFLSDWEADLPSGQQAPEFPPRAVSGAPKYAYHMLEFNCRFRTAVFHRFLARDLVQSLLPEWLELGPAPDAPYGMHPMMFGFGAYDNFGPVLAPWGVRPIHYHEYLCSIPNTRLKEPDGHYPGPFLFPVTILLDNVPALLTGVAIGYPKKIVAMESSNLSCGVSSESGEVIGSLRLSPIGAVRPATEIPAIWQDRASQPIVTSPMGSGRLFTHFQFQMELGHAQGADLELTVEQANVFPGFAQGTHLVPGAHGDTMGGMLLATPCHWQPPFLHAQLDQRNP